MKLNTKNNFFTLTNGLVCCSIVLLVIITILGITSFSTQHSYFFTNQYNQQVKIFGSGIYKYDSNFKALIFIGSDFTMLFICVPLLLYGMIQDYKKASNKTKLNLLSTISVVFYYATSIAFGVTYNQLHLLYILLFAVSFFSLFAIAKQVNLTKLKSQQQVVLPSKGLKVFLALSGIALFVAWLPDILASLLQGETLSLIEVYTTEITYILDMGMISPLMFICLFQLMKEKPQGQVLLLPLLRTCFIIGIMIPMQTLFHTLGGVIIPLPALITKCLIFVLLAFAAFYFEIKVYKGMKLV